MNNAYGRARYERIEMKHWVAVEDPVRTSLKEIERGSLPVAADEVALGKAPSRVLEQEAGG